MTAPYERLAQALADKLAAEGVVISPDLLKRLLWESSVPAWVEVRNEQF